MDGPISKVLKVCYRNRWVASGAFFSVIGGLTIYLLITPRLYTSKVRLLLDDRPASSITPLGQDLAQTPGDNSKALATQEELVRSKKVLDKAIVQYKQSQDPQIQNETLTQEITLGSVKNEITTQVVPGTQIIEISFRNEDPTTTYALLNLIAKAVKEENSETIRSEARQTRKFLEQQIPQRQQQLVSIEAAISQFKQQYNIVSLEGADNNQLTQSIASAEQEAQNISAQLQQIRARSLALSQVTGKNTSQETYQSTKAGQDPDLVTLRSRLADLESQLTVQRESFTEEHPAVQQLLTERNATQLLYQQKLSSSPNVSPGSQDLNGVAADTVTQTLLERKLLSDVEGKELDQRLQSTRRHISNLNKRRQQYPLLEKTLASLNRQLETATQSVKLLKQKLDEARIAEAQLVSNLSIIEEAEKPRLPSDPNIPTLVLLGTVAAFAFSIGIVLLAEGLDDKLRDLEDIVEFADLPLVGVIPKRSTNLFKPILPFVDLKTDTDLFESFRALSKNIQSKNTSESNILIVTSAISGEGKSHIASNLAVISAMFSKKTLLIDADFHRSSIHSKFQLPLHPGLQDILEENVEEVLSSFVQKTSIKNLSVMTAGKFSYNNIVSIESGTVNHIIRSLATNYDFVVVDTPPIMATADALTISDEQSSQTILVARLNGTPKSALKRAIDITRTNNMNLAGLVINDCTLSSNKYYQNLQKDYALAS